MIDSSRRTVLTTGAAAAAATAAPPVSAKAPRAAVPQGLPAGLKVGFYEKGDVRIRFAEIGSGFPLLATPGRGLNSHMSNWPTAVINIVEEFKSDFRVITMDQRNATNGESTGPIPVANPWDAFADDQLGLMDHLGIRQFLFFGIGQPKEAITPANLQRGARESIDEMRGHSALTATLIRISDAQSPLRQPGRKMPKAIRPFTKTSPANLPSSLETDSQSS